MLLSEKWKIKECNKRKSGSVKNRAPQAANGFSKWPLGSSFWVDWGKGGVKFPYFTPNPVLFPSRVQLEFRLGHKMFTIPVRDIFDKTVHHFFCLSLGHQTAMDTIEYCDFEVESRNGLYPPPPPQIIKLRVIFCEKSSTSSIGGVK